MKAIQIFQYETNIPVTKEIDLITVEKMQEKFQITDEQLANFLGQLHHESGGFKYISENLNYSISGLKRVFSKYFKTQSMLEKYARKPEKIASRVYADRMGNGNEKSGDGWKFRGRGVIQITGFNNYNAFSKYVNDPSVITNPHIVLNKYVWDTADWFFRKNGLYDIATQVNESTTTKLTRRINGGYNGLKDRVELVEKYFELIKSLKIQRDEQKENEDEQILQSDNTHTDVNVRLDVPEEQSKEQTSEKFDTPIKKTRNKKEFITKVIRWILSKISGRHSR